MVAKRKLAFERAAVIKERLRKPTDWFPFPLIISFTLVLLLTSHVLFATNPRAGHPADVITLPATPQLDSTIWLSVTPVGGDIVVTSNKRKVFRWGQDTQNAADIVPFVTHLKDRVAEEVQSAALLGRMSPAQTVAVIAADQRLKYLHMRPVLYALAQAGIASYSFETQLLKVASASPDHAPAASDSHPKHPSPLH